MNDRQRQTCVLRVRVRIGRIGTYTSCPPRICQICLAHLRHAMASYECEPEVLLLVPLEEEHA